MFSMVYVPLYDTLGTEAVSYIINQSEYPSLPSPDPLLMLICFTVSFPASMSLVTCDTADKALAMLEKVKETPSLKCIVLWQPITEEVAAKAKETGVDVITFQAFLVCFGGWMLQDSNHLISTSHLCYFAGKRKTEIAEACGKPFIISSVREYISPLDTTV